MSANQTTRSADFSARGSLSGYLFQVRYAFLNAVQRLKTEESFSITNETIDDIVFEYPGSAIELLQTKHHLDRAANLTDSSSDLWKTIRIWCEQYISDKLVQKTTLYLLTTSHATNNSVAACLKIGDTRNILGAITRLNSVAGSSTSVENKAAYDIYKSLTEEVKLSLFNSIFILDGVPSLGDLDSEIRNEIYYAVESKYLDSFITRIEGWWFRRVMKFLSVKEISPILSEELDAELGNIREQFKADNLPIDEDILLDTIDATDYQDRIFVQQLKLIEIGYKRIFFAIRDYYRAYTQRSRWLREDLLYIGELDRYELRLIEEWEMHFESMRDELGGALTDEEMKKAAQILYRWIEEGDLFKIRSMVSDPCIPRGSYHILADSLKVGWHLKFADRLRELLNV
jgi:hypothetical protein